MIRHILVPLDGSELAEEVLLLAKDLATRLHAKIQFLQVFEGGMLDLSAVHSDGRAAIKAAAEQTEVKRGAADHYLSQLVSDWQAEGIDAECTVVEGTPARQIIKAAHSLGVDLIAMSTHGRSGLGRLFSGSVADEVLRESGIPVLMVKASHSVSETTEAAASPSEAETAVLSHGN